MLLTSVILVIENSLSTTKACDCEAGATNRSTAKTDSWLYASGQLLCQNSRGMSPIMTLVWISAMYLLIIPMTVVDIDTSMGWLSVTDWDCDSFRARFSYSYRYN